MSVRIENIEEGGLRGALLRRREISSGTGHC